MDNQKVRSYLRKGELAVALLESLGYRYEEKSYAVPKWIEPAKVDPAKALSDKLNSELLQPLIDRFQEMLKETENACPVSVGTVFTITDLPSGHFLRGYSLPRDHKFEVVETRFIKEGSHDSMKLRGFSGWTVSFDMPMLLNKRRLWLPVSCIKVTADARF